MTSPAVVEEGVVEKGTAGQVDSSGQDRRLKLVAAAILMTILW